MKRKILNKVMKIKILWQWTDIALCVKIYKQSDFSDYNVGIDIQILFLNLWIQCFRKN